jgi:hypothetical protein
MIDDDRLYEMIDDAIAEFRAWTGRYLAGSIDWDAFKAGTFRRIRSLYYDGIAAAVGEALTQEQRALIEQLLAEQFYPHGEGFSLTEKFEDKANLSVSWAMFAVSVGMYFKSVRGAAYQVKALKDGDQLARRILGATDQHCNQCLLYAALPPMKLKDMVVPGAHCSCYTNCLCMLVEENV